MGTGLHVNKNNIWSFCVKSARLVIIMFAASPDKRRGGMAKEEGADTKKMHSTHASKLLEPKWIH